MASVYKRGNIWWGRVQHKGKVYRESLETTRRNVAVKRLGEWIERMKGQSWGDKPRRTFNEMGESFIVEHMPTLLPTAQRRYMTSIKMMIPHFESLFIDEITSSKLSEYEAARRRDGASSPTIIRDLRCLSSMFTHAQVDKEWTDTNPVTLFLKRQSRRGRLKESKPGKRYLSHEEEVFILTAAKGDLEPLIAFAIDTGLRLEEQLSLTWEQVNFQRREIYIEGKGRKKRTVPLLPRAMDILQQHPRRLRFAGETNWVFCHPTTGERYGKRTRGLAAALKSANEEIAKINKNTKSKIPPIDHFKWHDLRRTCGCRLLQDHEMSMEKVSFWLGHSSVKVTESTYAFLNIENLHDAAGTKTVTGHADSQNGRS